MGYVIAGLFLVGFVAFVVREIRKSNRNKGPDGVGGRPNLPKDRPGGSNSE